ncbi:MAG: hypothetical protein ACYDCL_10325 [Myxococcales bacterium]
MSLTLLDTSGVAADPCVQEGLACHLRQVWGNGGGYDGACGAPAEFDFCEPQLGCGASSALGCVDAGTYLFRCLQLCASTSDCTDPTDRCATLAPGLSVCFYDFCGPGSGGPEANGMGGVVADNGASFYGACDAAGAGDGYCLPYQFSGASTSGLCHRTGNAAVGAPCSQAIARDEIGQPSLCEPGYLCVDGPDGGGRCLPACAARGPGGPACDGSCTVPAGTSDADWGLCLAPCRSDGDCAEGLTCRSAPLPDGGAGSGCLP